MVRIDPVSDGDSFLFILRIFVDLDVGVFLVLFDFFNLSRDKGVFSEGADLVDFLCEFSPPVIDQPPVIGVII